MNVFFLGFLSSVKVPTAVTVDSSNQLYLIQFDSNSGTVISLKISSSFSYMSAYTGSGIYMKAQYAENWDFYLSGTSRTLDFSGDIRNFPNDVGYVFGLE